jgi:hypothetical protein
VTNQQSVRQAARRSAWNTQAVLRKQRADRERRLEALAVEVLTALGERDGAIRDAELRAGGALVAVFSGLHQATRASGAHEPTKDFGEVRGVQR